MKRNDRASQHQSHRHRESSSDTPAPDKPEAAQSEQPASHDSDKQALLRFWIICYKEIDNRNTIFTMRVLQRATFFFFLESPCGNIYLKVNWDSKIL